MQLLIYHPDSLQLFQQGHDATLVLLIQDLANDIGYPCGYIKKDLARYIKMLLLLLAQTGYSNGQAAKCFSTTLALLPTHKLLQKYVFDDDINVISTGY